MTDQRVPVVVQELTEVAPGLLDQINHLLGQLSNSASPLAVSDLERIVQSQASRLFLARRGEHVLGMTTLVLAPIPTGLRAIVEDVVVDEHGRGQGVGRALVEAALDAARRAGARHVDLTSRPSRVAAHALYRSIGFVPRDTTVYRYAMDSSEPPAPQGSGGRVAG